MNFPPKGAAAASTQVDGVNAPSKASGAVARSNGEVQTPAQSPAAPAGQTSPRPDASTWIPVLGRSAAGVAQFWGRPEDADGLTTLEHLIQRHQAGTAHHALPATVSTDLSNDPQAVEVITLTEPADDVAEFVSAGQLKARHPDAFAVRIDGQSMEPEIRHGDLVVLSPSVAARDGKVAVVQLDQQIGVTCKLYRRSGDHVHLAPINDQYPIMTVPAGKVVWALRVLARVRP